MSSLRSALWSLCVVVVGVLVATSGCPQPDPPIDEPCPFGTSRPDLAGGAEQASCVFPWQGACAGADDDSGCLPGSPARCGDDARLPPVYDCATCGCADSEACVVIDGADEVNPLKQCQSADVREGERSEERIDDGLVDDESYVGLFRRILDDRDALTRDEAIDRLRARRLDDPRRSLIVVGSDEGDTDDVLAPLFDGSFGDVGADVGCDAVDALGAAPLLTDDDNGRVNVSARDVADDAGCLFAGVFARCEFPSVAGCATARGILPETVVLLGQRAILDADNAMLRKATRANREQWLPRIEAQLTLFFGVFQRSVDDRFFVDDVDDFMLFVVDEARPELVFALDIAKREGASVTPAQLRAFRALWTDAPIQQFLTVHDITPDECLFDVVLGAPVRDGGRNDDVVRVDCQKNGASVVGPVLLATDDTSGVVLSAP